MGMIRSTIIAASFVLGASAASATTVTLQQQSASDVFAGGGAANVRVQLDSTTYNANAGGFRVTDGTNDFIAWCLDLVNNLSLPSVYSVTSTPFSNTTGTFSASVQHNLQRLFNTSYRDLDLDDNVQSAGFQLALWEIVYEGDPNLTLNSGDLRWVGGNSDARTAANTFLNNLDGPETEEWVLTFFESGKDKYGNQISQNLVKVAPIPLPAAVWMLGGGIVLMGAVARRRRKAESA